VTLLSPEQQGTAQDMDRFAAFGELVEQVAELDDGLSTFALATPQLSEARSMNVRDAVRNIAVKAEQFELALWIDDSRAWALADSIRIRACLMWDEWKRAKGEKCMWLAQERAGPIRRQLRAISHLCELLEVEMKAGGQEMLHDLGSVTPAAF
jgi:hypothetical protein